MVVFDEQKMIDAVENIGGSVDKISDTYYEILIRAYRVNDSQIGFKCPFCYSSYNSKKKCKRSNAKHIQHLHGLTNDFKDNYTHRSPHCYGDGIKYLGLNDISYQFKLIDDI